VAMGVPTIARSACSPELLPNMATHKRPTIMSNILVIRGRKVLLDYDLAALYQVETKAL
jgi:hypothetical protein